MKRLFVILAAITATVVICATACSKATENENADIVCVTNSSTPVATLLDESEAFEELKQELEQLADVYPSEIMMRNSNRPFWQGLKKLAVADAVGACCGIVQTWTAPGAYLGAVYSSLLEFVRIMTDDNEEQKYIPEEPVIDPNINISTITGNADYMGYIHNLVLYNIYDELGQNLYVLPDEYIKVKIVEECAAFGVTANQTNSYFMLDETLSDDYRAIMNRFDTLEPQQFIGSLSDQYPEKENEISLFGTFCLQYDSYTNQNTKDNYTLSFINIVRGSSINTVSKNCIISAVSVANASDKMWVPVNDL